MNFQDRINLYYQDLTDSDKKVISQLQKLYNSESLTVQRIADAAHVSTTTVHRTIHKLGYRAFTHFKHDRTHFVPSTDLNTSLRESILKVSEKTLENFYELDNTLLYKKLCKATKIYTFGTGNEQLLALQNFAHHFMYYGNPITQLASISDLDIYSRKMQSSDLVIICSLNGNTTNYDHVLQTLKIKQIPILSVTRNSTNELAGNADYNLYFIPDFHSEATTLHWPAVTLNLLLDTLIHEFFKFKASQK